MDNSHRPLVIAHRGDSAHAPENTLAGFRSAREAGAEWIELDVRATADGDLVCLHDATLERTTDLHLMYPGRPLEVARWSTVEVKRLDAGAWYGSAFHGERVPKLVEALELAVRHEPRMGVLVELKVEEGDQERLPQIVSRLAADLRTFGYPEPHRRYGGAIVQSFHPEALRLLRQLAPRIARFQLVPALSEVIPALFPDVERGLESVEAYAQGVAIPGSEATPDLIARIRKRQWAVFVWTVNDPSRMKELGEMGVDGVITDDPRLGCAILAAVE